MGTLTITLDLLVYKPQNIGKPLSDGGAEGQERMCGYGGAKPIMIWGFGSVS